MLCTVNDAPRLIEKQGLIHIPVKYVRLGLRVAGYSHREHSVPTSHRYGETVLMASFERSCFIVVPCASGRLVGRWLALCDFSGCSGRGVNPGSTAGG